MDSAIPRRKPARVLVPVRGADLGVGLEHGREEDAGAGNVRQQRPDDGRPRTPDGPADAEGAAVKSCDRSVVVAQARLRDAVERLVGGSNGTGPDGVKESVEVFLWVLVRYAGGPVGQYIEMRATGFVRYDAVGQVVQQDEQRVGLFFVQNGTKHL
ncbi:uncharacterized protein PG986_010725 [Apiospora aurea]|uniref:Uncharacterized protein n=1 Tax=Apiospora aurea TaxID=335848 RepID=A0ABR1Q3S5_9PEZI